MTKKLHGQRMSPEWEEFHRRSGKKAKRLCLLGMILFLLIVLSAAIGASSVDLNIVVTVLKDCITGSTEASSVQHSIVMRSRLPRIFAAVFAGGALSLAGLLMQGIFRNPLVSPYTLGVSNGASFGACVAIVLGYYVTELNFVRWLTPALAFASAVLTMLIVYGIAKVAGQSTKTLVLTGSAIAYFFSALVSGIKYAVDITALPELVFWQMGSLTGLTWDVVGILLAALAISATIALIKAWDLNVMALGREEASALGVNYRRMQAITFVLATLLTATAVSFTGVIGFVGLVAPHITRMLLGNDYRYNVPASVLLGSCLLLLSDTIARVIIAPTELPVGIVTSLIGVPFFLYLVVRRRRVG